MWNHALEQSRRQFFTSGAAGLGGLALASLWSADAARGSTPDPNPLAPKAPHFAPRAKNCIFLFLAGAPSHVDLYDPKPILREQHGQALPKSLTEKVRFAFIKKESAILMGSPRKFTRHGDCGMEVSDLLPHIGSCADDIALVRSLHTDAFNHHPAQLMMTTGVPRFGRPSLGSWLTYGLGSESENLPGYVVMTAGRGSSGGVSNWTSGFLPSTYEGVVFRSDGEPVLNLNNPQGVSRELQASGLQALTELNRTRLSYLQDPEIASRIAAYELAYRMQTAAPDLIDLSGESQSTLELYGVTRKEPAKNSFRGGGPNVYQQFSKNCLLARRMVERGVRCVTLMHASWDHHSNLDAEISYNAGMLDQPAAALVKDLKQRGMLDDTLVICAGEFGRTPLAENRGGNKQNTGRDHHPYAFSLWMAGGGIRGGQVFGQTDDIGWAPVVDPVHVNDLHATILHQFGFDHHQLVHKFKGLNVRLTDQGGKVIKPLIS
ncbi:MAG TPA: sulfatase [Planctomycetaceae bacterium]|nr:sulfatase [Blastopirellula sp.]HAY80558.1 sulfatase [Planctomycetaceae bacterium]